MRQWQSASKFTLTYRLRTKQIFGGRYVILRPFADFRPCGARYNAVRKFSSRARSAREGKRIAVKSPPHARVRPLRGRSQQPEKQSLACVVFGRDRTLPPGAARIIDLCLSPAHETEYGRRPVQHCCECARSARRNFRVSLRRTADFRPPVTPCQQIFALRYENLFCRTRM